MDKDNIKNLIVLGAGESGVGAAILGIAKGMDVLVSDSGVIPEKYKTILQQRGIPFEEGGHSEERILNADLVVKSPGIPPTAPIVRKIVGKDIPVVSEIEFAGYRQVLPSPTKTSKMILIDDKNKPPSTGGIFSWRGERRK